MATATAFPAPRLIDDDAAFRHAAGRDERWKLSNERPPLTYPAALRAVARCSASTARLLRKPCVLVVEFRLQAVRGRGHAMFRRESLLNTPLFAGFPGLVSKLWLADDERGRYRGCMSGIARGSRKTTPGPCGGCSPWCRCGARSTTSRCRDCAGTRC